MTDKYSEALPRAALGWSAANVYIQINLTFFLW